MKSKTQPINFEPWLTFGHQKATHTKTNQMNPNNETTTTGIGTSGTTTTSSSSVNQTSLTSELGMISAKSYEKDEKWMAFEKELEKEKEKVTFCREFLKSHYEKFWDYCIENLYEKNEKLFTCFRLIQKLEHSLELLKLDADLQNIRLFFEQKNDMINQIKKEFQQSSFLLEQFDIVDRMYGQDELSNVNSSGWILIAESEKIKSFYHSTDNLHTILLDGVIHSSMFYVLSVLYEVDLYHTWVPKMSQNTILKEVGKFKFLSYYSWDLPWPFSPRDIICYGYGVDAINSHNSILVVIHSESDQTIKDRYSDVCKIPRDIKGSTVRMDCNYAGFIIEPLSDSSTRLRIISNVDPKLAYIPLWLQNMATKHAAFHVMKMIRNHAENASKDKSSPYQQRIREKVHIYNDIARRLKKTDHCQ